MALDTLTVTKELVSDADKFFELFANASERKAFCKQLDYKFDANIQESYIEVPEYF